MVIKTKSRKSNLKVTEKPSLQKGKHQNKDNVIQVQQRSLWWLAFVDFYFKTQNIPMRFNTWKISMQHVTFFFNGIMLKFIVFLGNRILIYSKAYYFPVTVLIISSVKISRLFNIPRFIATVNSTAFFLHTLLYFL